MISFSTEFLQLEVFETVEFFTFRLPCEFEGALGAFRIAGIKHFFALSMVSEWWMSPSYGTSCGQVKKGTQLLVVEYENGSFQLFLPLFDGDVRASLEGDEDADEIKLIFEGAAKPFEQNTASLLASATGNDPFKLMDMLLRSVRGKTNTFMLREEKKLPDFINYFGWCTWDAFYSKVTHEKIRAGLESFKQGGAPPGFMILDCGWQDVDNDPAIAKLLSFDENRVKFPWGIEGAARLVKDEFGLKYFGVWHTLHGYWLGVKKTPAMAKYRKIDNEFQLSPEKSLSFTMVLPEDAEPFIDDYHSSLKHRGVDFVKVDNQSSMRRFCYHKLGLGSAMTAYLEALQKSVRKHFKNGLLNCMGMTTESLFNLTTSAVMRNSDDYFPRKGLAEQHHHLHVNIKCAFFSSGFSWLDFDMFQSRNIGCALHAVARSLSGGPVYVCDAPGHQDFELIRRLCLPDGRVLRPDRPGLPTRDCLFCDVQQERVLLKMSNLSGECGILGVFNCCDLDSMAVSGTYSPADIHDLAGEEFAAYLYTTRTVLKMHRHHHNRISLKQEEYEVITFAPVKNGFAVIGDISRYIAPPVVTRIGYGHNSVSCDMSYSGEIACYSEQEVASVELNGREVPFEYSRNLLLIKVEKPSHITIILQASPSP